ncbi:MAG: acetate--CoA ligase [archaeon]
MVKLITKKGNKYWPTKEFKKTAWVNDEKIYKQAEKDPIQFWENAAKELHWEQFWKKPYKEKIPFFKWFLGGKMNICYNAVDRHLPEKKDKTAIIWKPEPVKDKTLKITYKELYENVCKTANILKKHNVKKGDVVTIYLPMIPEVVYFMLACARIGAIHSVVFSAFSTDALRTRIKDGRSKILITSDGYYRKGKKENLLEKANQSINKTRIKTTIVVKRINNGIKLKKNQYWYNEELKKVSYECEAKAFDSETPLFLLYTSGTTGKPKGIIHETGGYATQAYQTAKWNFNLHPEDIIWCTADVGWVTGHTYICYGPLLNGATTLMFEGMINFPNEGICWKTIQENKVTVFYTAPTAIRMFKLWEEKWPKKYNLKSLKILGTVGEPIDKSTWEWYFKYIGNSNCPVIDTWWQTETGATLINSLPGIGPFIPSVAGKSFPGTKHQIINEHTGKLKTKGEGYLIQLSPFAPGMLRGVWRNKKKYKEKYWKLEESNKKLKHYITGDAAEFDGKYFRILGRIDDVIKVAGHRLSTAEIEDAVITHKEIIEAAVVSKPDKLKAELPVVFAKAKTPVEEKEITDLIVKKIGPIAKPDKIYFIQELPKTRSGKIMRRILKNLLRDEEPKGLSTLVNPESFEEIKKIIEEDLNNKKPLDKNAKRRVDKKSKS